MVTNNCPVMRDITNDDQCLENFAGLGSVGYIFVKDDLVAPLQEKAGAKGVYSWPENAFKAQKRMYKVELKSESQSITAESQGKRKGFKQTAQLIIEVVNPAVAELCRALNNLDWGLIMPDGDAWQIMYSPQYKIVLDAGALKTETGAASSDERVTTLAPVQPNVSYPNTYVEFAEGKSPEDYLAAAS